MLNREHDVQKDGFMDYPKMNQINIANRWQYENHKYHSQTFINYLHENRTGGQMGFDKSRQNDTAKKDKMITDDMIECESCKTYVSLNEAILSNGKYYCSKDCLNK